MRQEKDGRTNSSEEEAYAAVTLDLLLVAAALGCEVGRVAVEQVRVLWLDIDVAEQVLPHERVVCTIGSK